MVALPGSTADADDSRAACTTPVVNSRTVALGVKHELTGDPRSSTPSLALRIAAKAPRIPQVVGEQLSREHTSGGLTECPA
jgi:hypothetical protein